MNTNPSRKSYLRETYDKDMLDNITSLVSRAVNSNLNKEGRRNSKLIYPECVYFDYMEVKLSANNSISVRAWIYLVDYLIRESSAYKELGEYDGDWALDKFFKLNRRRAKELGWDNVYHMKPDKYSNFKEWTIIIDEDFYLEDKTIDYCAEKIEEVLRDNPKVFIRTSPAWEGSPEFEDCRQLIMSDLCNQVNKFLKSSSDLRKNVALFDSYVDRNISKWEKEGQI